MPRLFRNILALFAGVIVSIVMIGLLQAAAHGIYPPPPGLDYKDPEVLKNLMMTAPAGALLIVLFSYLAGTFVGAWVAAQLSGDAPARQAYLTGALMLVASIMNLRAIPHPVWFAAGNIVVVLVATFFGAKLGVRKAAEPA